MGLSRVRPVVLLLPESFKSQTIISPFGGSVSLHTNHSRTTFNRFLLKLKLNLDLTNQPKKIINCLNLVVNPTLKFPFLLHQVCFDCFTIFGIQNIFYFKPTFSSNG